MPGIADIVLGAAPIAGGALVAAVAGSFKGPDYRAMLKDDLELLAKIPPENTELRAALQRTIDERIGDLVDTIDASRRLRQSALENRGDWRDFVVFMCAVLFTLVWWQIDHQRSNWIVMFVVLVGLSVVTGLYTLRGLRRNVLRAFRRSAG